MRTSEMTFFPFDIETFLEYFLAGGKVRSTGEIITFRINTWNNDLYKFVKFVEQMKQDTGFYWVGYNSVGFDAQVVEYIVREYQNWHNLSNLEICRLISQKAQDVIDDGRYDIQPRYREFTLSTQNIDLFKVHHFDNENNRCSLKWLEFMMDLPVIDELPIPWNKEDLTQEECDRVEEYWHNDLYATNAFLDITLGNTEHELYKNKNKIQDRLDVMEQYKFPLTVLNWSDVKIGEQINLHGYCRLKGIKAEEVYELKKKRKPTRPFTFGKCIPEYVKFETPEFNAFYEGMKKEKVLLRKKVEYPFSYKGTKYVIAKGGIHSVDAARILISSEDATYEEYDVSSQYPSAIVKRLLYPSHLGEEWLVNYKYQIVGRLDHKRLSIDKTLSEDQRRIHKGLSEAAKLSLNGGGYPRTNFQIPCPSTR